MFDLVRDWLMAAPSEYGWQEIAQQIELEDRCVRGLCWQLRQRQAWELAGSNDSHQGCP